MKNFKYRLRQGASYLNRDRPALLTFLFHSIFRDNREMALNHIDPQQGITVDIYRIFLEYFLEAGYKFISPDELLSGLAPDGRYILATFDDGYFNNRLVLPLLQEYKCPALFYITTHNVLHNECFWWDAAYRELSGQGMGRKAVSAAQKEYKELSHLKILERLRTEFGKNVMTPRSDIDRPFTPAELKDFAAEKYVFIGNHTSHHYILDTYGPDEQRKQMESCQVELQRLLGFKPKTISYPNGNYNHHTVQIAGELGFEYGVTVDKRKNYLPLAEKDKLRLGRFVLWGDMPLRMQFDIFRSDVTLGSGRKPS